MSESKDPQERSVSGDFDESDLDSHLGDVPNPPGKPGRKKNPNSQAARRDQNRIAQREFRLRKQQRIRDLEARVEILSGGQDEALGEMRNILRDLMAENHTLRTLIRSLAGFIGDGAGGLLPKLGWELADFNAFINKSETDTAWEGYQQRKKTLAPGEASSSNSQTKGHKRYSEDNSIGNRPKKPRSDEPEREQSNGYPLLVSMNHSISAAYSPATRPQDRSGMFSDLIRGTDASPLYMQQSPSTSTSSPYNPVSSTIDSYQAPYISNVNMTMDSSLSAAPFDSSSARSGPSQRVSTTTPTNSDELEPDDDPNKNEAYKLIQYHLDNFKRNPNYCLPLSLRPTLVQKTVPHESVIDNILHPELRDRMILLRTRYSLPDCLIDYRRSILLHGDDVLAHSNWEINETFLRKYGYLIDQATLGISNRWRKERGEPELRLSDLTGSDSAPS